MSRADELFEAEARRLLGCDPAPTTLTAAPAPANANVSSSGFSGRRHGRRSHQGRGRDVCQHSRRRRAEPNDPV